MRRFVAILFAVAIAGSAAAQDETEAPADDTQEQLAGMQSQIDALARLPAEEAEARRSRAQAFVEAYNQLADAQRSLEVGDSDVTSDLETVQAQIEGIATSGDLGQAPEEIRWTRASVISLDRALDELGRGDTFGARQELTLAALQLERARAVALAG